MTSTERVVFISDHFKTPRARRKWLRFVDSFGVVPDKVIARRMDVSIPRVCTVRRAMGIAPVTFSKHCEHYGTFPPARPLTLM